MNCFFSGLILFVSYCKLPEMKDVWRNTSPFVIDLDGYVAGKKQLRRWANNKKWPNPVSLRFFM